ncbi:MAG TPA: hypothetical protein VGM25_01310 [Caulobacteraceae bacterium]|jgi:hypothetical protein
MPARSPQFFPQPFGPHDYRIQCLPPEAPRQVNIRGRAAAPLAVGDRYTIDRHDCIYDLIVEEISRLAGGRWNARCRVSEPLCL